MVGTNTLREVYPVSALNELASARPVDDAKRDVADDLSRQVYGLLGIPLDAIGLPELMSSIRRASDAGFPFLISTPNVNFLIKSQINDEFRESMLASSLCIADGMPLIWIAKLLNIPVRERVAGSDVFERMKKEDAIGTRLKVFLFGGADGLAEIVCEKLNAETSGLQCVGVLNPGFGSIDDLSAPHIINTINAANADIVAVFFGCEKAQAWLLRNHARLNAPVRAQFGATINFEAGTVKRAPPFLKNLGFEWLWRIKEEPYLWRRYWSDGKALLAMLVTNVLPLMASERLARSDAGLSMTTTDDLGTVTVGLSGRAVGANVNSAIEHFRKALSSEKTIVVDVSKTTSIDARFFGLFLMVRKQLSQRGQTLVFTGVSSQTRRFFQVNRFEFLLSQKP